VTIVTELLPLGPFATWQAERAVGDHDRNTLRLRLDPQGDSVGLDPNLERTSKHHGIKR
jgi:HlyD family secretion protein